MDNVNEDFVMFLISKLITCFTNGFTSGMKSRSIASLPIGSAHIYWILDLEGEVHSIWDLWSSNAKATFLSSGQHISVGITADMELLQWINNTLVRVPN